MIVTAAISFWNPDIEELRYLLGQCIPTLEGFFDRVVAFDGAYEGFPGATASSGEAAQEVFARLCDRAGLELEFHSRPTVFSGHVAKRQRLMELAIPGSDWVCAIDTDYLLTGDVPAVRAILADTDADLITAPMYMQPPARKPDASAPWHAATVGQTLVEPFFIRALPGFRYERRHWCYSALKDGVRESLWGCDELFPPADRAACQAKFEVCHRKFFRSPESIEARRQFYARRKQIIEETGVEP